MECIWTTLCSVLHLTNVQFDLADDLSDGVTVVQDESLEYGETVFLLSILNSFTISVLVLYDVHWLISPAHDIIQGCQICAEIWSDWL